MDCEITSNDGELLLQNEDIVVETEEDYGSLTQNSDENILLNSVRPKKRTREEEMEENWIQVRNKKERLREIRGSVEISITAAVILPKQFALAKLFKTCNITNINKVKYINPHKIVVEFADENNAKELINCTQLKELGWRFQKPFEVGLSYGVIKNIELELSEKELAQTLSTPNYEIVNVRRLKRRTTEEKGWTESESVRVGFRGPLLPSYIYIYEMKIKVEPYIFPVTQCSKCWRFGHSQLMCPSKRIFCPKCGGKHANCETTIFKCVNCSSNHIVLNRSCPVYLKEKKIRQIMSDNNVSYRKAASMYEPTKVILPASDSISTNPPSTSAPKYFDSTLPIQNKLTYSEVAGSSKHKKNPPIQAEIMQKKTGKTKKEKRKGTPIPNYEEHTSESEMDVQFGTDSEECRGETEYKKKNRTESKDLTFIQLLKKLKNIMFVGSDSLKEKIQSATQLCMEWIISYLFSNIANLSLLQNILKLNNG